jgi:hypothetical protein
MIASSKAIIVKRYFGFCLLKGNPVVLALKVNPLPVQVLINLEGKEEDFGIKITKHIPLAQFPPSDQRIFIKFTYYQYMRHNLEYAY